MSKNCRFGCNDQGKYFQKGKLIQCPDHVSMRREEVRQGELAIDGDLVPLHQAVGMAKGQWYTYNTDQIIPQRTRTLIKDGLRELLEGIDEVHRALVNGDKLEASYCFGLPSGTRALQLGFSFLVDAYKNGQSISPMVSSQQYHMFLHKDPERVSDKGIYYRELKQYEGIYTSDVLVVNLMSGGNSSVINTAKGLMQSRAMSGLPTVFITTKPEKDVYELVNGEETYYTAKGYFVRSKLDYDEPPTTEGIADKPKTTMEGLSRAAGGRGALEFNPGVTTL